MARDRNVAIVNFDLFRSAYYVHVASCGLSARLTGERLIRGVQRFGCRVGVIHSECFSTVSIYLCKACILYMTHQLLPYPIPGIYVSVTMFL